MERCHDDREALDELVLAGLITSDGFYGRSSPGRWSLFSGAPVSSPAQIEIQADALLRRYGVVFRRLLTRESNVAPWRELARVYRRLEARGYVSHRLDGKVFVYRATVAAQSVAARAVQHIIDRFCAGSVEQFLVGMVDERVLSVRELERLARKVKQQS